MQKFYGNKKKYILKINFHISLTTYKQKEHAPEQKFLIPSQVLPSISKIEQHQEIYHFQIS